jgi:hypothetical protein
VSFIQDFGKAERIVVLKDDRTRASGNKKAAAFFGIQDALCGQDGEGRTDDVAADAVQIGNGILGRDRVIFLQTVFSGYSAVYRK